MKIIKGLLFEVQTTAMLLSDSGSRFSILIRQAKPVLSKKSVINPCDEGKLSKAFCEKHKNHVDPPGPNFVYELFFFNRQLLSICRLAI